MRQAHNQSSGGGGGSANDDKSCPSKGWYGGELWFFDNYIIPLAKKLDTCGAFGISTDEFLSYATENRKRWQTQGADIVAKWLQQIAVQEAAAEAKQQQEMQQQATNTTALPDKETSIQMFDQSGV
jgi:hypothetical protein